MQTARVYEYEVYLMDDTRKCFHKGEVILATNNLAVACSYCYDYFKKFGISIGVYQPRTDGYREHYRAKPRDAKTGRFVAV